MKSGWIKLHRKLVDNPVVMKDSDYLALWVYLLLQASHAPCPIIFKGEKITLKPGQLITGRKVLSSELKIDENKVTRILKTFENEQQIEQQTSNKNLEIEGVLLTMFDGRTNLSIQVADEVKKFFGSKVYKTIIPRNVRLSEAPSYGEPIIVYDPKSKGADVYTKLAKEVIKASKTK